MSELAAVLFDLDGTVCDSEPAWMASERAMATRYGATWTEDDAQHVVGFALLDSGAYMKERMGLKQSAAEVVEELMSGVLASLARGEIDWRPGALELVQACNDAGVPTGLVTMSYRAMTDAVTASMPIGRFDVIVTGDEIKHGKPAPDPYLKAAEMLGVDATACVAIEDSPTGSASGAAAGCLVVVVLNHVDFEVPKGMVERSTLVGITPDELAKLLAER